MNNPYKVDTAEKWNQIIEEASRKATINAGKQFQAAMMSFYAEFVGEKDIEENAKEKFQKCAEKYFNLSQTIV